MCDVSQYDIDSAVGTTQREAEHSVEDLRYDLERRINDLASRMTSLERRRCPCQDNDNCP